MKKYTPETREELRALCDDLSVNLGDIDTSKITDMSDLFHGVFEDGEREVRTDFSGIETWNVSNVKNMSNMFCHCDFSADLSSWDVSSVENTHAMFYCSSFNSDISNWDVSNVKDASSMFELSAFNQNINNWKLDLENINYECFAVRGDLSPENYPVIFREYNPELFEFEDDITQEEQSRGR